MPFNPPPAFPHLEFQQEPAVMTNSFAIYNVLNDGLLVHTAVVSYDTEPSVDIAELIQICNSLQIVTPAYKINHAENGRNMVTLLYQPFTTLGTYIANRHIMNEQEFVKVMQGILQALLKLQNESYILHISEDTVVISEDGQGSILFLKVEATIGPSTNQVCFHNLEKLEQIIRTCAGTIVTESENLSTLMACMLQAWTKSERLRLLKAPFFFEDLNLVDGFIGKIHSALTTCEEYRSLVMKNTIEDCEDLLEDCPHDEVKRVYNFGDKKVQITNDFELVCFIRNCHEHMNHHWIDITKEPALAAKQASKNTKKTASKGGTAPKAPKVEKRPPVSPLMSKPWEFIEFILTLSPTNPNIFNRLFQSSFGVARYNVKRNMYQHVGHISMLDDKVA